MTNRLQTSITRRGLIAGAATMAAALTGCSGGQGAAGGLSAAAGSASDGGARTLRVAMELAYPPFETKDDAGNPSGVSVTFMQDFADAYGYDLHIDNISFDGLIPSLQTGKADCVMSSITITPEREEEVDFTDPYAMAQLAILAGADSGVGQAEDLNQADKTVAVKTGSTGDVYATKNLANAQILRLADESACVTEVAQGRADGFLYDQLTIYRNNLANPDTTRAVFIPFQDPEAWGIAVASGNDELREELNAFIAESKENGEFDRLTEQYLADEKAAFDELGFRWFFDFDDADAEGTAEADA
ncbi:MULTISPECIES: transporter substrate-binding domain-containing protein [Collinsella]|uniref:transporter substrate-binding domain-containing protein n=1 Tax=Collinsella TaxID=102106 RepID=UPI000B393252|nr:MULTISPECIES: transporter substrate-binding domain-containing protein [Collinsella]MBM6942114.1 transporter substrate-binding domain-containing protein [Collinsella intestinalis]OUO64488.1 amino acid ABC transporter substrate-binding protein [Collinsella sp. An268]